MSIRIRSIASSTVASAALIVLAGSAPRPAEARLTPPASAVPSSDSTHDGLSRGALARISDSLRGFSGKLFARFVSPAGDTPAVPVFQQIFGDSTLRRPGMYPVTSLTRPFSFIALHPFSEKRGFKLGDYRLGFWPAEKHIAKSAAYANPDGFIEVTPANEDTQVSEHFRLRDFLTHDQPDVWPKYLVLSDKLVDKLELVVQELNREGVTVKHMTVMSGFRTPWYNAHGGQTAGRAEQSRHMYGDASDVFVDNDGTGRMSDLNHDGRINSRDAKLIADAAERVGLEHPDLVGGEGVYAATRSHGPFAHIDVRGTSAHWGLTQ